MTKREAAIIALYTGVLIGDFAEMHRYAQELAGGLIFTHEFANEEFCEMLKEKARADFLAIEVK
jgi:hypothetical protein